MARQDFEGQTGGGGLGSEPFEMTVTAAFFGESEAYSAKGGGDTIFMHWLGTTDFEPQPVLTADSFHPSWAIREGWRSLDGGKTITHPKMPPPGSGEKKPALGRQYGVLVERLRSVIPEMSPDPLDRISPWDSSTFVGTKWRMIEEEYEANKSTYKRLMPIEFLGFVDAGGAAAAPAAAAPATPAASNGADDARSLALELAKTAETKEAWQAAALAVPSIASQNSVVMDIVNPASSIWAEARS